MAAKAGDQHHTRLRQIEDQRKFISFLKQGIDMDSALAAVGKKRTSLRSWLLDGEFAAQVEEAINFGSDAIAASLGENKHKIDFATFSREFLNTEVTPFDDI